MHHHLIIGGNGFVGSVIAKILLQMNQKVTILDIIDDENRDQLIHFIKADILDEDKITKFLNNVDYVYHAAALVPINKAGNKFQKVNVDGTKNIINACKINKVKHLIFISSSAVFGNLKKRDCPIKNTPKNLYPIESYGISKANAESLIMHEINKNNLFTRFSIVRPRTVVGKERLGIFAILFEWIFEGRNIYIIGNGKNIFQFIHINDLCSAIIKVAYLKNNGIYNIGNSKFSTLENALTNLINYSGSNSRIIKIPVFIAIPILFLLDKLHLCPLAPYHYLTYHKDYYFDISNEKKLLNWEPKYSNDEIFKDSYKWYVDNKNKIKKNKSVHKSNLKQRFLYLLKKIS